MLASSEFRGQVDWAKVQVFWSDERAVPPDNPESNYGMARRELLVRVPIPAANVHRMEAEKANIGRAAHEYEEVLRKYLELDDRGFPRFHLILLGMGTEGHTASLFPGTRVTRQTSRWVSTPMVAKLNARRMTLTLPVLDAAMRVVFLVVGSEKAEILHAVLQTKADPPYPAQLVQPRDNGLKLFLVDEAAAAMLVPADERKTLPPGKPAGTPSSKAWERVMILAGDIGGTKCNLALYELHSTGYRKIIQQRYESRDFAAFDQIIEKFLSETRKETTDAGAGAIEAAGFGVAGPVINHCVKATNLPWAVDGATLKKQLATDHIVLLNDLEATGYSLSILQPSEISIAESRRGRTKIHQGAHRRGNRLGRGVPDLEW